MKSYIASMLLLALVCSTVSAAEKPRVFVLTDIENEPDDAMSMVRFLTYANHFDVEGLAATTSIHQQRRVAPQRIRSIVEAYGKVRDNLEEHEQQNMDHSYEKNKSSVESMVCKSDSF